MDGIKQKRDNELNVWSVPMAPWRISNLGDNLRDIIRRIKWSGQRVTRGFCDYDTYDLDLYYRRLIVKSLKQFVRKSHTFPFGYDAGLQKRVRRIIANLEYASKEAWEFYNPYAAKLEYLQKHRLPHGKTMGKWSEFDLSIAKKQNRALREAFWELGDILYDLWA